MTHDTGPQPSSNGSRPPAEASSANDLHPRPNIRRIGRLGTALTLILFLAGLTVLTFKYSRDTVTRASRDSIPTGTRPLGPDQIARLRPPEPPDLEIPSSPEEASETEPVSLGEPRPRRRHRSSHSFGVRRPSGVRRPTTGPREPGRPENTSSTLDPGRIHRMEEAIRQAIAHKPSATRPVGEDSAVPTEPRRFAPSEARAVHVSYIEPLTRYELKEGSYLPAMVSHELTSELAGPVRAQVSRDVYDSLTHEHLLIPRGTRLLGRQSRQPVAGERRISIVWERLVLPDGRSVDLTAGGSSALAPMPSASADGTLGLRGRVHRHWPRRLGTAALVSLVGAGVQLSQPQRSATGLNAADPGQIAAGELGLNLGRMSERFLERTIDQPPTIELAAGTRVFVFVTRDLAFETPYSR